MAAAPPTSAPAPEPKPKPNGFHGAVSEFKRRLIEATLTQAGGNRTRAARALGLQRTYLLRLMREFQVHIPPPPGPWRRADGGSGAHDGNGGGPPGPSQRV
jgi:DNA-binding NtrC family response regulator